MGKFPRSKRLDQRGVLALLKGGSRAAKPDFELKYSPPSVGSPSVLAGLPEEPLPPRAGRVAIAVPKKKLASAVARNRVKRLIREQYRLHPVADTALDLLVTLRSTPETKRATVRANLRQSLVALFDARTEHARKQAAA